VKPHYQGKTHPHYVEIPHEDGMAFTSAYDDLRNLTAGKTPIVAFDGGRVRQTLMPTSFNVCGPALRDIFRLGLAAFVQGVGAHAGLGHP
jgi:hypothetical protein